MTFKAPAPKSWLLDHTVVGCITDYASPGWKRVGWIRVVSAEFQTRRRRLNYCVSCIVHGTPEGFYPCPLGHPWDTGRQSFATPALATEPLQPVSTEPLPALATEPLPERHVHGANRASVHGAPASVHGAPVCWIGFDF